MISFDDETRFDNGVNEKRTEANTNENNHFAPPYINYTVPEAVVQIDYHQYWPVVGVTAFVRLRRVSMGGKDVEGIKDPRHECQYNFIEKEFDMRKIIPTKVGEKYRNN